MLWEMVWLAHFEGNPVEVKSLEADIGNLSFIPPKIMSQFVKVRNLNLAEKHFPPMSRCLSQGNDKEGDPRHFIGLSGRPLHQGKSFENS